MEAHFVNFLNPGSFVAEQTRKDIVSWDIERAVNMAREIKERYGARPYAFYFTTRSRDEDDLDSKITETSCTYYLGGVVRTLEDVKEQNNPENEILIRNMECNNWDRIICNDNSWSWTQPLRPTDIVLDVVL